MLHSLIEADIRQTLDHFRRSVDQLFENFFSFAPRTVEAAEWTFSPAVESYWTDDNLKLRVVLPGVDEKDVKVTLQGNQLVIEGERKAPEGMSTSRYTSVWLPYGRFYRTVDLPNGLDLDKLSCRLNSGILEVTIPVAEAMKPRRIQITAGEERKAISA